MDSPWRPLPAPEGDRPSNLTELLIKLCLWENAQWQRRHYMTEKIAYVVIRILTIALSTVLLYALIGSMFAITLMWWPALVPWEFGWLCATAGYTVLICYKISRVQDKAFQEIIGSPRYAAYMLTHVGIALASAIGCIMLDIAGKLNQ